MIFLDTDVVIELCRGGKGASEFLDSVSGQTLSIPGLVAMEFVTGAIDKRDLDRHLRALRSFDIVWSDAGDQIKAFELYCTHRLPSGLGLADSIIGAQYVNRGATLYSFNLKHFRVITGIDVRAPWNR